MAFAKDFRAKFSLPGALARGSERGALPTRHTQQPADEVLKKIGVAPEIFCRFFRATLISDMTPGDVFGSFDPEVRHVPSYAVRFMMMRRIRGNRVPVFTLSGLSVGKEDPKSIGYVR